MSRRLWAAEECIEDGCTLPPLARSLCSRHYQRRKAHGEELPPKVRVKLEGVACAVPGCPLPAVARQMCPGHTARARRYGLTHADLAEIDATEACAICGGPAAHVDHDHETGEVRGVLCRACNTGLGMFQDDQARLAAAIRYLSKERP